MPREKELFYGAKTIGWTLMIFSFLMILGGFISIWDGFRSGYTFGQFFFSSIFRKLKAFLRTESMDITSRASC